MAGKRHPVGWWVLMTLLALAGQGFPQGADPSGPPVFVLRFHNGSVVQPAILLDSLEIESKIGKLSIPAEEVRRIQFGFRLSVEEAKAIDQALRDLESQSFKARETATKKLTEMGRLAFPILLENRNKGDLEMNKRVESILQVIRDRVPAYRLQTRRTDIVRTTDSSVSGNLLAQTLRFRCDLFGEVKVPITQLREMSSLLPGGDLLVAVDANKYGHRNNWLETEFEATPGMRLDITVSGEIELDPNRMLNGQQTFPSGPAGTPQLNSGEGPLPGILLGKIGADGPIFTVGPRYQGVPDREGKLYFRIVTIEQANNIKAKGSFQVKISAEPN